MFIDGTTFLTNTTIKMVATFKRSLFAPSPVISTLFTAEEKSEKNLLVFNIYLFMICKANNKIK